jgi:anti-sigma factor RsiW
MKIDENLCAEIEATLPLYVGGDLEAQALGEVRDHLARCPACAERALSARSARREMVSALRLGGRPGPSPPLRSPPGRARTARAPGRSSWPRRSPPRSWACGSAPA